MYLKCGMGQLLQLYIAIIIVGYTILDNVFCLCNDKLKEPVGAAM